MIASLKPYSAYKPSSIEWLEEVPANWSSRKIKHLARPGYKTFVDGDWIESPYITSDGIRLIQTGNIGEGEYKEKGFRYISEKTFKLFGCTDIEPDDILICRLGEPVARACRAPQLGKRMITSVDVCILKLSGSAIAQFLVYSMSSYLYLNWVGSLVRGSTRDRVSRSMLGSFLVPLPTLPEQTAIVRYLNYAERRIQRHIRVKQKLIALLKEQKQAILHQAVTGRIDVRTGQPYPTYKPSGVEWLGEVPEHWSVVMTKRNFKIKLGKMLQNKPNKNPENTDRKVPYLKAKHVQWFSVHTRELPTMWANSSEIKQFGVRPDDLLVCEGGEGGRCGIIKEKIESCIIQNALHRVRSKYQNSTEFLQYILNVISTIGWFEAINNKATIAHFTAEKFSALLISIPTLPEQTAIIRYLNETSSGIDDAVAKAHREIELLREYRERLIADVVTGKLDVRAAAAALPEIDPLADEDTPGDTLDTGFESDIDEFDVTLEEAEA